MSLVIRLDRSIAGAARTGQRVAIEVLPILGKPSAAVEPSKGAFDDPTAWKHHESFRPIGALDDFQFRAEARSSPRPFETPAPGSHHRQRAFSRKGTSRKGSQEAGCRHRDLGYRQDE